jgi:ubiquitin-conjugating enzyme E2 S
MSTKDVQKVTKELMSLHKKPLEGITVDEVTDVSKITASIEGPIETPFENGVFHVILELGDDFPNKPPTGKFLTKIFHPNVSKTGEICVNTLKKDWESTLGISHVLQVFFFFLKYFSGHSLFINCSKS